MDVDIELLIALYIARQMTHATLALFCVYCIILAYNIEDMRQQYHVDEVLYCSGFILSMH